MIFELQSVFEFFYSYITFLSLKEKPIDQLRQDPKFGAHALRFINALDNIIASLDEPDVVIELLKMTGATHARFAVTPKHFEVC